MITTIKRAAKNLRTTLGLSPTHFVLRRLKGYGFDLSQLEALEVFGSERENHTAIFAAAVGQIDIWEIKPTAEEPLRQRFPQAGVKPPIVTKRLHQHSTGMIL